MSTREAALKAWETRRTGESHEAERASSDPVARPAGNLPSTRAVARAVEEAEKGADFDATTARAKPFRVADLRPTETESMTPVPALVERYQRGLSVDPPVVDERGSVLDGHHRIASAAAAGFSRIFVVVVTARRHDLRTREAALKAWDTRGRGRERKVTTIGPYDKRIEIGEKKLDISTGNLDKSIASFVLGGTSGFVLSEDEVDSAISDLTDAYALSLPSDDLEVTVSSGRDEFQIGITAQDGSTEIYRRVYRDKSDTLAVDHALFDLPSEHQAEGIGKAVMRDSLKVYDQLGIKKITTGANINVGAYAWARYGFTASEPRALAAKIEGDIADREEGMLGRRGFSQDNIDLVLSTLERHREDPQLPWILSEMRDATGKKIGFDVLRGFEWKGELDLTDPAQRAKFEKYIGAK